MKRPWPTGGSCAKRKKNVNLALYTRRLDQWYLSMREKRNAYRVLMGKPEERDHVEDLDVNRNALLKMILKELDGMSVLTGLDWLRIGTSAGCCGNCNEHSDFIKCWELFTSCGGIDLSKWGVLLGIKSPCHLMNSFFLRRFSVCYVTFPKTLYKFWYHRLPLKEPSSPVSHAPCYLCSSCHHV
jgi:hypothetical protein